MHSESRKTMEATVYNGKWRGAKVSAEGLKAGYIDYACLASTFGAVLANEIIEQTQEICGYWEQISGFYDDEEGDYYCPEIYQYYIVDYSGAETLQEAGEIVFYNDVLDLYVWGVTHWGTAWSGVLTNIKIR